MADAVATLAAASPRRSLFAAVKRPVVWRRNPAVAEARKPPEPRVKTPLFIGAGVVLMTDGGDVLTVMHRLAGHRNWWQAFRGARHWGDFQGMLHAEINAVLWAEAIIDYLTAHGIDRAPIETFLAAEKRMVLHRMERCGFCWWTFKDAPKAAANKSWNLAHKPIPPGPRPRGRADSFWPMPWSRSPFATNYCWP